MKALTILYLIIIALLIAVIPVKLLTSVQSKCHSCGGSIFYSKRKKNFNCPHCGTTIIENGLPVLSACRAAEK